MNVIVVLTLLTGIRTTTNINSSSSRSIIIIMFSMRIRSATIIRNNVFVVYPYYYSSYYG